MKISRMFLKMALYSLIISTTLFVACDFEEINEPKYQASEEDLKGDNFNLGAFFPQLQDIVLPAQENNYQMSENLVGAVYSRYMMTSNGGWNGSNFSIYQAPDNWVGEPFKLAMVNVYSAWNEIRKLTDGAGVNFAWAQILRVAAMQRLTDMYGPIPYSKVVSGDLKVEYDSQEDAYKAMFVDLTAAIDVLTTFVSANPSAKPMADYDGVYDGDFSLWVKFANSLKLRMAIRIRYADEVLAKQMAEEAVSHILGVMTDNSHNAKYSYSKGNPLFVMWSTYTDTRICADFSSILNGYNDPRAAKYIQESVIELSGEKGFIGLRGGLLVDKAWAISYSAPKAEKTDPLYWMMVSEITSCRAEGALLGWNMGGDSKTLYKLAIKNSFDQWGVSGYDGYILDDIRTQADYEDPRGQGIAAVNTTTIMWDEEATEEEKLEKIITQKWIALFPIGQEAWSEHRRTGYPAFFPLSSATSYGDMSVAKRIPFPYAEYENNADNVALAIGLLGGSDSYSTKLWWDNK